MAYDVFLCNFAFLLFTGEDMSDRQSEKQGDSMMLSLVKNFLLMASGGIVVAGLLVGIGIGRTGDRFLKTVNSLFNAPPPKPEVDVRSLVVRQVRDVSELTTSVFVMQAVVPSRQDQKVGGYAIATTTLLYIAHGEVRAGVDLGEIKPDDVQVINDTINILLPPPRILDSKIDVKRSQVYDYNRGFLGLGPDVAPQLQTLAEREALQKIVATACSEGLLTQANSRAKLVVTQLLSTAGYKDVEVKTTPPSQGSCSV